MPNHLHRIDAVWMFISEDATGEGVCAVRMGDGTMMPLVAADETRLALLRPMARQIAARSGERVKLIKLTVREDLEILDERQ